MRKGSVEFDRFAGKHEMMKAYVNKEGIALEFEPVDNLPQEQWEILLDQLKSVHIPSLYERGRRSHAVVLDPANLRTRVTIFLTNRTVSLDEAMQVLREWNIEVHGPRP